MYRWYRSGWGDYEKALALAHAPERAAEENAAQLSPEELADINAFFSPFVYDDEGNISAFNPLSCFLTSYYESIYEMDAAAFMRNFPDDGSAGDEEFVALTQHPDWPFGDVSREDMNVPVHRYYAASIDRFLTEYAGATTAELAFRDQGSELIYLEEFDAYYNFTSDFGTGTFNGNTGEVIGERILVRDVNERRTVELELEYKDGAYRIVSHRLLK